MKLSLAVTGKLHAAAGASGPPGGSDEERPEEEGHRVPLGGTEARGLHPAGQRQVGVHLRETSAVPVQSEWLLKLQLPDSWLHFKVTSLHLYTFPNGRTLHEVNRLKRVRIPATGFGSGCLSLLKPAGKIVSCILRYSPASAPVLYSGLWTTIA